MSGTSNGAVTNFNGTLWSQESYFNFLTQHNITWRAYYQDDPWAIMYFQDMQSPPNSLNVGELEQFFADVSNGSLAQFTFLQPRMTSTYGVPTWQHPDAPVSEGEKLIGEVYGALRKSKFWNQLALIVTYDEHGGFYDHVPPPQTGVPSPDGVKSPEGFNFERLGIRVPAVVISPWIAKGSVLHEPTNGPTNTSQYDATSIMSTCNRLFNISEHLTKRAAWAGTFEHIFVNRTSPRTDCPMQIAGARESSLKDWMAQRARPLNDHMEIQVDFYCKFNKHDMRTCGKGLVNQGLASDFIVREAKRFMKRAQKQ
jgi:phospholipase C